LRKTRKILLLPLFIILIALTHINWIKDDLELLLTVDERPIDLLGNIENKINKLTRNCSQVECLKASQNKYQLAPSLIHD
jgi:hypothetical protein